MRRINKFKLFKGFNIPFEKVPKKLLKGNRPKWNRIKRQLFFFVRKRQIYKNPFIKKVSTRSVARLKNHFRIRFQKKKRVQALFDSGTRNLKKSQNKNKIGGLASSCTQPLFKLDILLWYLNFFRSLYEARQYIFIGGVLLNGKKVSPNCTLKRGDVITFDYKFFNWKKYSLKNNFYRYVKTSNYLTFVEADYYTKTIVVIKEPKDLSLDDFKLLYK